MEERRDPAIKLFGKTIRPWPGGESPADLGEVGGVDTEKETSPEIINTKLETSTLLEEEEEEEEEEDEKTEENDSATISSPDKSHKSIKSPPCPRCRSKATKFCYYNNYSINQPRHFCRNCLRYWTSGGVMRNLPVGAGRRKIKSPSNVAIIPEEFHHPRKPNETVLSFDSETLPTLKSRNHNRESQVPYINGAPCSHRWTFPIHFYPPTAYWSIPWLSQPLPSSTSSCSVLNSTHKHSRTFELLKHVNSEKEDALRADFLKVMYADPVPR